MTIGYDVVGTYSGVFDGATDNTTPINNALSAIGSEQAWLYFSEGVCYINGTVTIPRNVKIFMDGCTFSLGGSAALTLKCPQPIEVAWFGLNGTTLQTTGSITSGTASLTVASAANLFIGSKIRVTNAGAGAHLYARILGISGTTVTLDTNASTTVTNVSVLPYDDDAFTDCFACIPAAGSGQRYLVIVPPGDFQWMRNTVTLPNTTMTLRGAGRSASRIQQHGSFTSDIFASVGGVTLQDLFLNANAGGSIWNNAAGTDNDNLITSCWLNGGATNTSYMIAGDLSNFTIENCVFETGQRAIQLAGDYINISNCIFSNITRQMIGTTGSGAGVNINNCQFECNVINASVQPAVEFTSYKDININNVVFSRLSGAAGEYNAGMLFTSCTGISLNGVKMRDFIDVAAGNYGIKFDTCDHIMGRGIDIHGETYTLETGIVLDTCTNYDIKAIVEGATDLSSVS